MMDKLRSVFAVLASATASLFAVSLSVLASLPW